MSVVGTYLFRSVALRGPISRWWVASEIALVLGAQLGLFGLLRLLRRASTIVRGAALATALVLLTPALNALLMVGLPVRFMIEASTAPARNLLTEICVVRDVDLIPGLRTIFDQTDRIAIAVRNPAQQLAVVTIPGCTLAPLPIPPEVDLASLSSASILWTAARRTADPPAEWFVTSFDGSTRRIDGRVFPPNAVPKLLDDGETIGWIERGDIVQIALAGPSGGVRRVPVPSLETRSVDDLRGASASGPFHMSALGAGSMRWLTLDGSGTILGSIDAPPQMSRFSHYLLTLPAGWIAWDTYVEGGRYRFAWARDQQVEQRELARGLGVTSVAVDAQGAFIAASATSGLNIGSQPDEVWLVRTSDGTELFRRYAPKYSRATVALPGGRYFAVSEIDGTAPAVRIYALPDVR